MKFSEIIRMSFSMHPYLTLAFAGMLFAVASAVVLSIASPKMRVLFENLLFEEEENDEWVMSRIKAVERTVERANRLERLESMIRERRIILQDEALNETDDLERIVFKKTDKDL